MALPTTIYNWLNCYELTSRLFLQLCLVSQQHADSAPVCREEREGAVLLQGVGHRAEQLVRVALKSDIFLFQFLELTSKHVRYGKYRNSIIFRFDMVSLSIDISIRFDIFT